MNLMVHHTKGSNLKISPYDRIIHSLGQIKFSFKFITFYFLYIHEGPIEEHNKPVIDKQIKRVHGEAKNHIK